ncbi:MAG: osmotically inducible protein C, partial [Bacteroidota bacterium]
MRTIPTSFPNRAGLMLSASLDLPLGIQPRAYAIFAHCFTCGKNLRAKRTISLALTQAGIAVLRFDFT